MANGDQLKSLMKSHFEGDDNRFYSVAMQVAANSARSGHGRLARELRDLVDKAKAGHFSDYKRQNTVAINQPKGDLANLLSVSYPEYRFKDMVLDETIDKRLQRILKEQRHHQKIRKYGLSPRRKLLLVGPPGTGKTMSASVLAGELGIPLFLVRLDALITKFMGETAAKLRQLFDAIAETRGIYFFDEFDAIGSQRSFGNDVGEIRRVLNSFLQMIEQDDSTSMIISATNHPEILDYALFRRFDDVVEYSLPDQANIIKLLKSRLTLFNAPDFELPWEALAQQAEGLSYAEIARAAEESIKSALICDQKITSPEMVLEMINERKAFIALKQTET
ncbi:MAG: ATP-binding protein [Magnetococcales bacterium]|nr:ATP-binding protein [Magnetococcales bacterium]